MTTCTEADCTGTIAGDGYCDTCGTRGRRPGAEPSSTTATTSAPAQIVQVGGACAVAGCGGTIAADGYCDTCGTRADPDGHTGAAPHAGAQTSSSTSPSIAAPRAPTAGSTRTGSSRASSSTRRSQATRGRLGVGLVDIAPTIVGDPAASVMSTEEIAAVLGTVPEQDRFCSSCGQPVGRSIDRKPGRVVGFCSNCRTAFDHQTNAPVLVEGETVAGQYEILGPIAHGGMGWIYLGRDRAVSNRWVVLKGLLNENDPDAAASAVAERQFLAQIEHANIVNIYNFVTHLGRGYIVMEYVGGDSLNGKLKQRRRENNGVANPMPPEEAIAYLLGILPAFGYLHGLNLVYNDLKPANVMAVGADVKLIDVGAVMRIDDTSAAIFGTQGFQAPDVAAAGPSIASDLYTVGRTLAVLVLDFVFHEGEYRYDVPPPRDDGVLRKWESLHRFLLKATAPHPDDRFQSADEAADQLTGVLREIVAVTDQIARPVPSHLFSGDRLTSLLVSDQAIEVTEADWRSLPVPKPRDEDPSAAFLEDLEEVDPEVVLDLIQRGLDSGQVQPTAELHLRVARAQIAVGSDPAAALGAVEVLDPWDWRVEWYRAVTELRDGDSRGAAEGFSRVWTEVPGELAPRLGAALASEAADEYERAAELYERIVSVDHTYVSAAFGLARCHRVGGNRDAVVAAYHRVPASSATYQNAQLASARALVGSAQTPGPGELREAASIVDRLTLGASQRARLSAEILERALAALEAGALTETPGSTLLGRPLDQRSLRLGLEQTYREQARLAVDASTRIGLVDRANRVRPRSLI